jgi:4'-phosphopantetheinyl transferase
MPLLSDATHQIATLDGVDLWLCNQDELAAQVDAYTPLLSAEELTRADRFHFERDRNHFIVGRAVLRLLLAQYVALSPEQIALGYRDRGKPYLLQQPPGHDLRFNLAHAAGIAIYAVTRGREVGVDIEQIRSLPDAAAIARHFFAPAEIAAFRTVLGTEHEAQAFFNAWTRKEAFLKALGDGLARPLDSFEVSLLPGDPARLLRIDDHPADGWQLYTLDPLPGYVVALVVEEIAHTRYNR